MYGAGERAALWKMVIFRLWGWNATDYAMFENDHAPEEHIQQLHGALGRMEKGEPVQYVFGVTDFYGMSFSVSPDVLVPRPETEELVELVLQRHPEKAARVLDVGTGSGCIAVSLKKERPGWKVDACDVSAPALAVAMENAKNLHADIGFFLADACDGKTGDGRAYDLLVSNPPYIPQRESGNMHENVVKYEPHVALFAPDKDPFRFYKCIAGLAFKTGARTVFFEIHHDNGAGLRAELQRLFSMETELVKDLSGKYRFLVGRLGPDAR